MTWLLRPCYPRSFLFSPFSPPLSWSSPQDFLHSTINRALSSSPTSSLLSTITTSLKKQEKKQEKQLKKLKKIKIKIILKPQNRLKHPSLLLLPSPPQAPFSTLFLLLGEPKPSPFLNMTSHVHHLWHCNHKIISILRAPPSYSSLFVLLTLMKHKSISNLQLVASSSP